MHKWEGPDGAGNSRDSRATALSVLSCWLTVAATAFAGAVALSPYGLALRMITAQVAEIVGPFMLAVNLGRILPFVLPIVAALLPILFPTQAIRILSAVLLCALSLFAIASIGLFCIPGAIVMTLAACARPIAESPAM